MTPLSVTSICLYCCGSLLSSRSRDDGAVLRPSARARGTDLGERKTNTFSPPLWFGWKAPNFDRISTKQGPPRGWTAVLLTRR